VERVDPYRPLKSLDPLLEEYRSGATALIYDHVRLAPDGAVVGRDGLWSAWCEDSASVAMEKLGAMAAVLLEEQRRLATLLDTTPRWSKLSDVERGLLVLFFEHAMVDGLSPAWESLQPSFPPESGVAGLRTGTDVQLVYAADVDSLDDDEMWRLQNVAAAELRRVQDSAEPCSTCGHAERSEERDESAAVT
jgi:hypothetical protein